VSPTRRNPTANRGDTVAKSQPIGSWPDFHFACDRFITRGNFALPGIEEPAAGPFRRILRSALVERIQIPDARRGTG
jgi:hypothetical protein